jgi:DNA-directed RNA polymerase specialized sigma24 family protein
MDHEAIRRLPRAHSVALRLAELGADDQLIADAVGIEIEGVDALVSVARAKLDALVGDKRG